MFRQEPRGIPDPTVLSFGNPSEGESRNPVCASCPGVCDRRPHPDGPPALSLEASMLVLRPHTRRRFSTQPSISRGSADVPLLDETIGANLERTVGCLGDREALAGEAMSCEL